jgi:hypothetical protein
MDEMNMALMWLLDMGDEGAERVDRKKVTNIVTRDVKRRIYGLLM